MGKFNYDAATVAKYHNHGWFVSRDIKPACGFDVDSEEAYAEAADYIVTVFPGLKLHRKDIDETIIQVHVYKYDHIRTVLDELSKYDCDNPMLHVLNGYIYGIPPHMVENFLAKQSQSQPVPEPAERR